MVTFRNQAAVFEWRLALFGILFFPVVITFSLTDKIPPTPLEIGGMVIFSQAWLGFALYFAARKPCITVVIRPEMTMSITWYYPFKTEYRMVSCSVVKPAIVVDESSKEGMVYVRFELPDGVSVDIMENHDRQLCEICCTTFNAAIRI